MNKLQSVRYQAAYTQLAQKLDKQIKEFDYDVNTQIRWDWQLIQNAKDAPNSFKATQIKQELEDGYFISSHNDDAFQINQLHSVVAQYSTKKQKNSQQTKTTGKYGTGFITTYILSKIIQLSGILKVEIDNDLSDDQETIEGNDVIKDADDLSSTMNRMSLKTKSKKKQKMKTEATFYYKQFEIPMDRSYIDRDEELPRKIQKTQKRLTKIVSEAEYECNHSPDYSTQKKYQTRPVQSFDTIFKYKLTDVKRFSMIESTIINVRQLIPYAFLFNDNMTFYEFIDNRKQNKNISFSITKGEYIQIGPSIFIFSYLIRQNYNRLSKDFTTEKMGYFVSYIRNDKAIAAIPIEIQGEIIKILKVRNDMPKIFKDFPLIGCQDTNWNAIINARQFYPNEKRSDLMLKYIDADSTSKDKVQTNWRHIGYCFDAVKTLYIFLSKYCALGLQNLLIFDYNNSMTAVNPKFRQFLNNLIDQIVKNPFIPTKACEQNKKVVIQPRKLYFLELSSKPEEIYNKDPKVYYDLSFKVSQVFSFLFNKDAVLMTQYYPDFYEVLNYQSPYRKFLQSNQCVNFVSLNDCLRKLEKLTYKDFTQKLTVSPTQKLNQIYSLLSSYNQHAYLSISKIPSFDFKIHLNENCEFKQLKKDCMKFNDIPFAYQEIAKILKIQINDFLLHKDFKKYIKETNRDHYFDVKYFQLLLLSQFREVSVLSNERDSKGWHQVGKQSIADIFGRKQQQKNDFNIYQYKDGVLYGLDRLQILFQVLITFNQLSFDCVGLIKMFKPFATIEPMQLTDSANLKALQPTTRKQLITKFVQSFTRYMTSIITQNLNFKQFIANNLTLATIDECLLVLTNLFKDKIVGDYLGKIRRKLSWSGIFRTQTEMFQMNQEVAYPDASDIRIYNIAQTLNTNYFITQMKNIYNKKQKTFYALQNSLINPLYIFKHLQNVKIITFKQIFVTILSHYDLFGQAYKHQVLQHVNALSKRLRTLTAIDKTLSQKKEAWKQLMNQRLHKLYQLNKSQKKFEDQDIKWFLYDLFDNPNEMKAAIQMYKKNNYNLYFSQMSGQVGPKDQKLVKK